MGKSTQFKTEMGGCVLHVESFTKNDEIVNTLHNRYKNDFKNKIKNSKPLTIVKYFLVVFF